MHCSSIFLFNCCWIKGCAPSLRSFYLHNNVPTGKWRLKEQLEVACDWICKMWRELCAVRLESTLTSIVFISKWVPLLIVYRGSGTLEERIVLACQAHVRALTGSLWQLTFGINEKLLLKAMPHDKINCSLHPSCAGCLAVSDVFGDTHVTTKVSSRHRNWRI